jgi:hypothetical protein
VAGESTNWLPPSDVQQSMKTTRHCGVWPSEKSSSTSSMKSGRIGLRFCHMSSWPVNPWMT